MADEDEQMVTEVEEGSPVEVIFVCLFEIPYFSPFREAWVIEYATTTTKNRLYWFDWFIDLLTSFTFIVYIQVYVCT